MNDFEYLHLQTKKTSFKVNRPRLLGCLSFFVFIFAVFSLERITCVHLYLFLDDFLQCLSSIISDAGGRIRIVTVA